ncbi:hypothetical protein ACWDG1_41100 [Streptomyces sp. NPDC001177]
MEIVTHIIDAQFASAGDFENDEDSGNQALVDHVTSGGEIGAYFTRTVGDDNDPHIVALFAKTSFTSSRGVTVRAGESVIACYSKIKQGPRSSSGPAARTAAVPAAARVSDPARPSGPRSTHRPTWVSSTLPVGLESGICVGQPYSIAVR